MRISFERMIESKFPNHYLINTTPAGSPSQIMNYNISIHLVAFQSLLSLFHFTKILQLIFW
jgi:hypothetical protein